MATKKKTTKKTVTIGDLLKQVEQAREALSQNATLAENVITLADSKLKDMLGSDDLLAKQHGLLLALSKGKTNSRDALKFAKATQFLLDSATAKLLSKATLAALIQEAMKLAKVTPSVSKRRKGAEVVSGTNPRDKPVNDRRLQGSRKTGSVKKTKKSKPVRGTRSPRRKSSEQFGIFAATGKMFERAFASVTYPETLSDLLALIYGADWRQHEFWGTIPGLHGPQHRPLGEDVEEQYSMFKAAIANGFKALQRCGKNSNNATPALRKVYAKVTSVHMLTGILIVLRDKWGIKVD